MRSIPLMAAALVGLALGAIGFSPRARAQDAGWTPLFNGKDLTGWKVFLDPKKRDQVSEPDKIFAVKDGILVVRGDINGYVRTEQEFGDYVLKVQWRWGAKV